MLPIGRIGPQPQPQQRGAVSTGKSANRVAGATGKLFNFGSEATPVLPVSRKEFPPSEKRWETVALPPKSELKAAAAKISWHREPTPLQLMESFTDRIDGLRSRAQTLREEADRGADNEGVQSHIIELRRSVESLEKSVEKLQGEGFDHRLPWAKKQVADLNAFINGLFSP